MKLQKLIKNIEKEQFQTQLIQKLIKEIEKKLLKTQLTQIQIDELVLKKEHLQTQLTQIQIDNTAIEKKQLQTQLTQIQIGDTVKIEIIIQKGNPNRTQFYEGTIIAKHKAGISTTITVRRIFQNIGVERVFPIYSYLIENIEIIRRAQVRKAKLYYLRRRIGKSTRLKQRFN